MSIAPIDPSLVTGGSSEWSVGSVGPLEQPGVDTESAAMAKNGLEYEALISVAKSRIEIFQSAMGVG